MMVPIEKVFLRNQQLQQNPSHHTGSLFYKEVRDSIKKRGIITRAIEQIFEEKNQKEKESRNINY